MHQQRSRVYGTRVKSSSGSIACSHRRNSSLPPDAVPVTLCATKEEPIADGEKYLPRNFCPLIKSSYGFAITEKCAFFNNSEFIIGETTCDGKKKMFELMEKFKPLVVLEVPQSAKGETQKQYWRSEVARCKQEIENGLVSPSLMKR